MNELYNRRNYNIIIVCSFIILAIANVSLILVSGRLEQGFDMQFHWQRILELSKSYYILPRFSLNSFSFSGSAVPIMYPYLFLYPFVFLFKLVKSVKLVTYLILFINTLISLIISYYSSINILHSRIISYLYSLMYSMSYYLFLNSIQTYALGMIYAFIFIPLVIFGFIYWIKDSKWIMLSIGMSLLIYSSVIASAFTIIFLLLWCILNYDNMDKNKLVNLLKAIGMTLLTSAFFWLPAVKLFLLNKLVPMGGTWVQGPNLIKVIISSLVPFVANIPTSFMFLMTIYSLMGLIVGIMVFKSLPRLLKQSLIISVLIIILASNIPWKLLNKTPLNVIQFPWRLYIIPQVLLTYICAIGVCEIISSLNKHMNINTCLLLFILIGMVFYIQVSNQSSLINKMNNISATNQAVLNTKAHKTDYYPQKSTKCFNMILNHKGYYNKDHKIKIHPKGNGFFIFKNNQFLGQVNMPFLYYHGIKYNCYLDGKYIKSYPSKDQLLTIHNVPKGQHRIHINIPLTKTDVVARTLTVMSVVMWIIIGVKYLKERDHVVD